MIAEVMVMSARSWRRWVPNTVSRDSDRFFNCKDDRSDEGRKDGDANSLIQNLRVVHK